MPLPKSLRRYFVDNPQLLVDTRWLLTEKKPFDGYAKNLVQIVRVARGLAHIVSVYSPTFFHMKVKLGSVLDAPSAFEFAGRPWSMDLVRKSAAVVRTEVPDLLRHRATPEGTAWRVVTRRADAIVLRRPSSHGYAFLTESFSWDIFWQLFRPSTREERTALGVEETQVHTAMSRLFQSSVAEEVAPPPEEPPETSPAVEPEKETEAAERYEREELL